MKHKPLLRSLYAKCSHHSFWNAKQKETSTMCSIFHKLLQHALTGFYIATDWMQWEHTELLLYGEARSDDSVCLHNPSSKPNNLFNRARCDPPKTSSPLINITGSQNRFSHLPHTRISNQKWPTSGPTQINMRSALRFSHKISQSEGPLDDSHGSSSDARSQTQESFGGMVGSSLKCIYNPASVIEHRSLCYLKKKVSRYKTSTT